MLTAEKLSQMILELQNMDNIGCTHDFKERYDIALTTLRALNLVTGIRTKIPKCDDHCSRSLDCQWIPVFLKKKSKSKFKLSKSGEKLADDLTQNESELKSHISGVISKVTLVDIVQSLIMENPTLTIEKIVTETLKQTKVNLQTIRIALKDILDLMVSLEIISIKEGIILPYG